MYGVFPEATGFTWSHSKACSGKGRSRGRSSSSASRTSRPAGWARTLAPGGGGEASRREEAVAQVLDRALNLTLFIPPVWGTGFWRVVIVAGEIEDSRMKADVVPGALQDDALQVVVENGPGDAVKRIERLDVPAQEALHRLVEREASVDRPRPGEHHHEAGERAAGGAGLDPAGGAP